MRRLRLIILLLNLAVLAVSAQRPSGAPYSWDERNDRSATNKDSARTKDVPVGLYGWRIDSRFGDTRSAAPDTLMDHFPQRVFTHGTTMRYNTTGNLGAPRMSRVYNGNDERMAAEPFLFALPYSYSVQQPSDLFFTNTKSPYTTLYYNKVGNKQTGEDRLNAAFAVNAGKKVGIGFNVDYLYGRGYYTNQNTSHVCANVYGSYRSERYELHTLYAFHKLRNAENGGLEGDEYITNPEVLPTSYRTSEMPVRLETAYNYLNYNHFYLTHRYHLGSYRVEHYDTLRTTIERDSVAVDSIQVLPQYVFNPAASVIHTLRISHNFRQFLSHDDDDKYFLDNYLAELGFAEQGTTEKTRNISVRNIVALKMLEGFRPWVKSGLRVFAQHDLDHFVLLDKHQLMSTYNENSLALGAQLMREQGKLFHFNVLGEYRMSGHNWGEFNAEGWAKFDIPVKRDSLTIKAEAYVRNERPSFYYRHYHGRNAWWDSDLHNIFRTRVGGELRWWKTRLIVGFENVKNYTHFANTALLQPTAANGAAVPPLYHVEVAQAADNIQTLQATLCQDFSWGPLRWENELTFQKSSNEQHLPLPLFTGYSNLFLKFRIAKVLKVELGADVRYFTRYYAPDYNPAIGMFATQSENARVKLGNYPWVNVYANFHLKRARFFVMYSHVNATAGNAFLVPHYPTNRRVLRFGISWSFIN